MSSAVRPTPEATLCTGSGTGAPVGDFGSWRVSGGGLHGGGRWVSVAVSAVALVDGVPSIDCMVLQRGERGPDLACRGFLAVLAWPARRKCRGMSDHVGDGGFFGVTHEDCAAE